MRCESVGVWASTPPRHHVCRMLSLDNPPSLWTGAADGQILRWTFHSKEIFPLALLCGHRAAIVGLQGCCPKNSANVELVDHVLSICIDGIVCVWESSAGLCSKRRQLPASIGQPTLLSCVPRCPQYVCIAHRSKDDTGTSDGVQNGRIDWKGGIFILDTSSLTVLQNVYQGDFSFTSMAVIHQEFKYLIVTADAQGTARVWSRESLNSEAFLDLMIPESTTSDKATAVAISGDGLLLILVYRTGWIVKSIMDGSVLAHSAGNQHDYAGGFFFFNKDTSRNMYQFFVWTSQGSGILYSLENSALTMNCSIPAAQDANAMVQFCQLHDTIVRVEFASTPETLLETKVSCWHLPSFQNSVATIDGCGGLWNGWRDETERGRSAGKNEIIYASTLLLDEGMTAVVYGYGNGDIKIIDLECNAKMKKSSKCLSWHTEPVLCLEKQVRGIDKSLLLISGSMDCCVGIWDVKEGNMLSALRHHVQPVRQIVLPPSGTFAPWTDCFLSVGDDGCVVLSSLENLRSERIFPGHVGTIKQIGWDGVRGYLAVLSMQRDNESSLYIWDLHSGALERMFRGKAASSMFKHVLGNIQKEASSEALKARTNNESKSQVVEGDCLFPGIAELQFDISNFLSCEVDSKLVKMALVNLHLWGLNEELDKLITQEFDLFEPEFFRVGSALHGREDVLTLIFPTKRPTLEIWKSCPELSSTRSLTLVSLAQRMVTLSENASLICSELTLFYSSLILNYMGDGCKPSLEIYACFWQDSIEQVRSAARILFHGAAARSVPDILKVSSEYQDSSKLVEWLECLDGQDKAARIVVAGILAVWYPHLVRSDLAPNLFPFLLNLVRATNDKHNATAGDILSAGMLEIWQPLMSDEIPQLIYDVLSMITCLSGGDVSAATINDVLAGKLLPSLAAADMSNFLAVVPKAAVTNPSVYMVAIMTIVQAIDICSKNLIPYLDQMVSLILQAMDVGNSLMKNRCLSVVTSAIAEIVRVFPMVAMYPVSSSTLLKIAVGDPIGDIHPLAIRVYDLNGRMKFLDASGPPFTKPGMSSLSEGISALSFSMDGEGVVAFSHQGLIIRWWSLGTAWWEKLSRTSVAVQCTKLVLVPPSPAFSPTSSSASIMATLMNSFPQQEEEHKTKKKNGVSVDLSFRLEWKSEKVIALFRQNEQVGTFQLL